MHPTHHINMKRRRNCLTCSVLIFVPLCLIIGFLGWSGFRLYTIASSLQESRTELEGILASAGSPIDADASALDKVLGDVRSDVVELQDVARPFLPLTPYLTWLPRVGPLMPDARSYLELADAGTAALDKLRPTLNESLTMLQSQPEVTDTELNDLIGIIGTAAPQLGLVESDVDRITDLYNGLTSKDALPSAVREYLPLADEFLPFADEGLQIMQVLPQLIEGNKTYHIWVQNDDELRATGGFVSGIAVANISDGDLTSLEFQSSDDISAGLLSRSEEYDYPPFPVHDFMGLDYFLFRDSNFWPDFPTSAEEAIRVYAFEQPGAAPVDGVIAIDQKFLTILLGAIGPVYVPALDNTVNENNVITVMRDAWASPVNGDADAQWWQERRLFISQMSEAITAKLFDETRTLNPIQFAQAMIEALDTRHLQVYVQNESVQQTLAELGWDGAVSVPSNQDFLGVVETNSGFNKVNAIMEQNIAYSVELTRGPTHFSNLELYYRHPGSAGDGSCRQFVPYTGDETYSNLLDRCYFNYIRVYPAIGSELVSGSAPPVVAETVTGRQYDGTVRPITTTLDLPGFANYSLVPRGGTVTARYDWTIPSNVVTQLADGSFEYRLTVRKQAGASRQPLNVEVTLPENSQFVSGSPTPIQVDGRTILFRTVLDRDQEFSLIFR